MLWAMAHKDDVKPVMLRNPDPLPVATLEDVKMTLSGLRPGIYLARDLYERYAGLKRQSGSEPVTTQMFGRMLRDFGLLKCQRKGARAWRV